MAYIPPAFLDTVVAIGTEDDSKNRHWIGTGFLFGKFLNKKPDSEESLYEVWLITNKHVLIGQKDIYIKFNSTQGSNSKDYKLSLVFRNGRPKWGGHPTNTIDVAAIRLSPKFLKNESRRFEIFKSNYDIFQKEKMLSSGISEGDNIFVLGFPMGLVDTDQQYVICRGGYIARIRNYLDDRTTKFLIDAPVFPGNSGGPVILCPSVIAIHGTKPIKRSALLGIVRSYVPYEDEAISRQTSRVRILFQENSGLAVVESVDSIVETVDLASKRIKSRISRAKRHSKKK
jgi:hypothetical protein